MGTNVVRLFCLNKISIWLLSVECATETRMVLFLRYYGVYVSEFTQENGEVDHSFHYFKCEEKAVDGFIAGTRDQALQWAVANCDIRQLRPGGRVGWTLDRSTGLLREHNMQLDDHGKGAPSVELDNVFLPHDHQYAAGDFVYVHWPAVGSCPAGWWKAVVIQG